MNLVVEIAATVISTVASGAVIAAVGFVYKEILAIRERLARIEEHLSIETKIPIKTK